MVQATGILMHQQRGEVDSLGYMFSRKFHTALFGQAHLQSDYAARVVATGLAN